MKRNLGFTLVELLVAMALFSIIGTVLFVQIHTVTKAKAKVEEHAEQLAHVQKALQIMKQDVEQIVQRSYRNESGDSQPALIGSAEQIEFIRTGWSIPPAAEKPRSELQRINYQLQGDQLMRSYWPYVDGGDSNQSKQLTLLKGIESFAIHYWYRVSRQTELKSSDSWPPAEFRNNPTEQHWPVMIEYELTTDYFGTMRRLFQLTQAATWSASDASGS